MLQPVLDPAVRLAAMITVVVGDERAAHPEIGFCFVLQLVKVIERLMHLFDGAERPLDPRVKPEGRLLPFDRAGVRRSACDGGMWVSTRTPRLPITDWNTLERLTGPLSM